MTVKDHNDEVVRKLTEQNKIADFAMSKLGMDERRAAVFVKACGDRFVWDGTLRFKGATGEIPADDERCTGFFQREYDFLVPAKAANEQQAAVPEDLIALAKEGNKTARAQIFRTLHGDKKGGEAETIAKVDALLAGKPGKNGERDRDDKGKFVPDATIPGGGKNPWSAGDWNVTRQGQIVKALGVEKAGQIAGAANSFVGAVRPSKAA